MREGGILGEGELMTTKKCPCGRPAATTGDAAKAGKCEECHKIDLYIKAVTK